MFSLNIQVLFTNNPKKHQGKAITEKLGYLEIKIYQVGYSAVYWGTKKDNYSDTAQR